jgi:hypothetical protein
MAIDPKGPLMSTTSRWLAIAVLIGLSVGSAPGEEPGDAARPLSDTREQDHAYGLSLRPPIATTLLRQTASRYLMQILDEDGKFKIYASVPPRGQAMTLQKFSELAQAQLARTYNSAQLLDEREDEIAGRAAHVLYVLIPPHKPTDPGRLLLGQAYVQIAANTFVVLEIEGHEEDQPLVRQTFESVLKSVEIKPPGELEAERRAATELVRDLFNSLTPEKVHASLIPEQIFRIVDAQKPGKSVDIGWMRIHQSQTTVLDKPGVGVRVQARFVIEDAPIDTLGEYFVADDDSFEQWSVTTTRRPPGTDVNRRINENTAMETGVRTAGKVEVRIDTPRGTRNVSFVKPDFAYLSQAHAWLLPQLLPPDRPAVYGSYFYVAEHARILYRTDQIIPTLDGFTLLTRLSPNDAQLKASYDGDRHLKTKYLSATRQLIPTTPQELKRLWPRG